MGLCFFRSLRSKYKSELYASFDGEVIEMSQYEAGVSVPSDMKYGDWKEKFVKDISPEKDSEKYLHFSENRVIINTGNGKSSGKIPSHEWK